jgi:hypothetical protein
MSTAANQPRTSISVSVTLREHVQPIDRGDRYEDPLFEALEEAGLGGEGDGGGTLCGRDGEIEEADFDVELTSPKGIALIKQTLERAGAAKGATLAYERDGQEVVETFGITEGVAIYLDGVDQAQEVYESTSAQELLDQIETALGEDFDFRGSWAGPTETALYLYGLDAEQLFTTIEPVLRAYPLSRTARVIVRYRAADAREVRLAPVASA